MFEDVSQLITANRPGHYTGVSVCDVDGDSRSEFVLAGYQTPNRVLKWFDGRLRDVAPPSLAETGRLTTSIAAADFDGDGREELYVASGSTNDRSRSGPDRLLKASPDGSWENLFARPENLGVKNLGSACSVAAIDRRGVGRYGFMAAYDDRPLKFFEQCPDGSVADLASAIGLANSLQARGVLALPIVSRNCDLLCLNDCGPNSVFRNRGDGKFIECGAELGLSDAREQGRAIAAVGNETGFDLCWGNWDGPHRLMARSTGGQWADKASPAFAFPSAIGSLIAADFDNDGAEEVFFNNVGEPNRLFRVTRNGTDTMMLDPGAALDPTGLGSAAAVCDIDGDGVLELLVARGDGEAQSVGLYKARVNGLNHWLRIRPLTRYGAPARGAIVQMENDGRMRTKGVCGSSGYRSQMEPVAHFGLGEHTHVDRVRVMWPDGAAVVLTHPRANRTITVAYPRS